jgi:lauroyl/myristoyl acyltransferase
MSIQNVLNSKFSVQFSILIGKYLPRRWGYGFGRMLGSLIGSVQNWDINRNVRVNQYVVQGENLTRAELVKAAKNVLSHAGRCYYDLHHYINKPNELDVLVPWTDQMQEFIEITNQDQGYLVVAPHISNFDLVVSRLVRGGYKGKVLSYPNPGSGYQLQNEIRKSYGLELTPLGDPGVEIESIAYLKSGGVLATGIDRPVPTRKKRHYVNFFGRPSPLPLGYITTALAADVPIIVVTAYMLPDGRYGFKNSNPIQLKNFGNKLDNILLNAEIVLKEIERFIKLVPEQWLMYYSAWPDLLEKEL